MATGKEEGAGRIRPGDRCAAWAVRHVPAATGFSAVPEPRSIGLPAHGRQLVAGSIRLAGHQADCRRGGAIWDIRGAPPAFTAAAQGFGWLDDLAALGTAPARWLAQEWTRDWIARHGTGRGPGWAPALAGRRLLRWIHHASFLMAGDGALSRGPFLAALARHAAFLARRARTAPAGLARIEALTGLLHAGLFIAGREADAAPAAAALAREGADRIDDGGAIASRNPEELLAILTLLTWAVRALAETGHAIPPALAQAVDRAARCLRVLRHADGGLARFHGGGAGGEGLLDRALSASAMLPPAGHLAQAMGYVRLSGGRSSVIVDAAAPPADSACAHASTGAFELTSGRRPLIVGCGPGAEFGPQWRLAARATQSHSALCVDGASSSRFGRRGRGGRLAERARVGALHTAGGDGALVMLGHDGWAASHGLFATRELHLSADGRRLGGTDSLTADMSRHGARFSAALARAGAGGIAFSLRFHLHPEVDATLDMGGHAVTMQLRSGEVWVFRHSGTAALSLQPSAWLERGQPAPRPTRQIVLSGRMQEATARIGWTLAKAQDTPLAIRDLDRDDPVTL